jgi:GTP-binding protein EngB required for normal cell division
MDNLPDNTARADVCREKTIQILEALKEKGASFHLAGYAEGLERCRLKLQEDSYTVLVVGEAKRGKSSFINAIIGRDILPTDLDVATSQVFRVSQGERENYRLRFEDGSQRQIARTDLARFGSQLFADEPETARLRELIKWIEVEVPIRFLPRGVALLDTPGTGSLHARHSEITYRYANEADAVLFVLDSERPIVQEELDFLRVLLRVTKNIFFVQTKIDAFGQQVWKEIQRRNQEILKQAFGNELLDDRLWPISSVNLRKAGAAKTEDAADDYLTVSRHKELAAALHAFLSRAAGWSRTVEALLLAEQYHSSQREVLAAHLTTLVEESKQKRSQYQESLSQLKGEFDANWGERGMKRKEAIDQIRRLIGAAKISFRQALEPGSVIVMAQENRIDSLKSVRQANRLANELSGDLVAAITDKWQDVSAQVRARCLIIARSFLEDMEAVKISLDGAAEGLSPRSRPNAAFKHDWWLRIRGSRMDWMTAMALSVPVVFFFPALAPLAGAGVLWATVRSLVRGDMQVRNAQQELRRFLNQVLYEARRYFFEVDIQSGGSSRVDRIFDAIEKTIAEKVAGTAKQKLDATQAEITKLAKDNQLTDDQRKAKASKVRQQLAEWDALGLSIAEIAAELKELDKSVAVPAG